MREWVIDNMLAEDEELIDIEHDAKQFVRQCREDAWNSFHAPILDEVAKVIEIINNIISASEENDKLTDLVGELKANREPLRRDIFKALRRAIHFSKPEHHAAAKAYYEQLQNESEQLYNTHLHYEGNGAAKDVQAVHPEYAADAPLTNGYEVLNRYFDQLFAANPLVFAFGEDVGKIGDVNQGFAGLQDKYGDNRIFDTGIRELTIIGQGIGMAMRGLRPIAEIQYLDYLLYGLQPLSDDLATLQFRTAGRQSAPLIVRTRGHRLEGIWHSGSPMGMIINSLRGIHVCVPRNMVQAVGMYNTLLDSCEPGLIIESLNGYRLKEKLPANLMDIRVALGVPEVIREGNEVTLVSYGSTLRIVMEAAEILDELGISCEIIDVQTLLPFDTGHTILESLKKTSRICFIDEDVPGGAAAYMFNKVMEEQGGYRWLDVSPRTLTAKAHRPGYGSDGDYFSKPNTEDIISVVKEMMAE
jgi:pyruvate/2-oxoglutarate/acetoin dehydrogenase E1 component